MPAALTLDLRAALLSVSSNESVALAGRLARVFHLEDCMSFLAMALIRNGKPALGPVYEMQYPTDHLTFDAERLRRQEFMLFDVQADTLESARIKAREMVNGLKEALCQSW
jgi:hypothetical protein